eukprot:10819146-Ditylum_brightwellii.AAC.1
MTGNKILHDIIPMAEDITITSTMGIATTPQKSVRSPSTGAKDALTMKGRKSCNSKKVHFKSGKVKSCEASSNGNKDLHMIINGKIAAPLEHKEKKELNKFEALPISSNSNKDNDRDINSRVSNTSNEDINLE